MSQNPLDKVLSQYPNKSDQENARRTRNENQLLILKKNPKINVDPVLSQLQLPNCEDRIDADNRLIVCLVARPPKSVCQYICEIQSKLKQIAPLSIWMAPEESLHMTLLELESQVDETTMNNCIESIQPDLENILKLASDPEVCPEFMQPLLCFDANAVALSFISGSLQESHLAYRSHLYRKVSGSYPDMKSRYYGPSAHITIARYVDEMSPEQVNRLVERIGHLNSEHAPLKWKVSDGHCELLYDRCWYGTGKVLQQPD